MLQHIPSRSFHGRIMWWIPCVIHFCILIGWFSHVITNMLEHISSRSILKYCITLQDNYISQLWSSPRAVIGQDESSRNAWFYCAIHLSLKSWHHYPDWLKFTNTLLHIPSGSFHKFHWAIHFCILIGWFSHVTSHKGNGITSSTKYHIPERYITVGKLWFWVYIFFM